MSRRSGAALLTVLYALALTAALSVGAAFAGRGSAAIARISTNGAELRLGPESALVESLATWDSAAMADIPTGGSADLPPSISEIGTINRSIARLTPTLYWLVGLTTASGSPPLRHRTGLMVSTQSGSVRPVPNWPWTRLP